MHGMDTENFFDRIKGDFKYGSYEQIGRSGKIVSVQ